MATVTWTSNVQVGLGRFLLPKHLQRKKRPWDRPLDWVGCGIALGQTTCCACRLRLVRGFRLGGLASAHSRFFGCYSYSLLIGPYTGHP